MKKTITLLALGSLTLALLAFAFVSAQAKPEGNVLLQATTTGTASGNGSGNNNGNNNAVDTPQPGSLNSDIAVWDQFCVRKVPYTLIAIRQNASFEMTNGSDSSDGSNSSGGNNSGNNSNATGVVITPTPVKGTGNTNEIVCDNVGVFRDRQVIVCRGPQLYSFPISVTTDGTAEEFMVPLGACPGPRPTGEPAATSEGGTGGTTTPAP